jgi:hypothetical protein
VPHYTEPVPQNEGEAIQPFQVTKDEQGVLRDLSGRELTDSHGFLSDPDLRESLHYGDKGKITDKDGGKYHIGKDGQVWKILSPDEQFSAIPELPDDIKKMSATALRSRIRRNPTFSDKGLIDLGGGGQGKRNFGNPSSMGSPFMTTLIEYNGSLGGGTPQNAVRVGSRKITKVPSKSDH